MLFRQRGKLFQQRGRLFKRRRVNGGCCSVNCGSCTNDGDVVATTGDIIPRIRRAQFDELFWMSYQLHIRNSVRDSKLNPVQDSFKIWAQIRNQHICYPRKILFLIFKFFSRKPQFLGIAPNVMLAKIIKKFYGGTLGVRYIGLAVHWAAVHWAAVHWARGTLGSRYTGRRYIGRGTLGSGTLGCGTSGCTLFKDMINRIFRIGKQLFVLYN